MLGQWSVRLVRRSSRQKVMREPIKLDEPFGTGRFDWIDKVARGALIVTGVVTAGVIVAFAVDSEQGF